MKRDLRQEAARAKADWLREKSNLEAALYQLQGLCHSADNLTKENLEKATILEKSILRHIEDRERAICFLEKKNLSDYRAQASDDCYTELCKLFGYLELFVDGFLSQTDLEHLEDLNTPAEEVVNNFSSNTSIQEANNWSTYERIFYLDSTLTDWQIAAARIMERELLAPRRIGSLYFLSGANSLLGMKLSFMVRIGLTSPQLQHARICLKLSEFWRAWGKNIRLEVKSASLSPTKVVRTFGNRLDALFLDYEILNSWAHEYSSTYADDLAALEHGFSFLILLLKQDQVDRHRKILEKMQVETFSLFPENPNPSGEDISTLLIAQRESRYILQYQRDSWDIMVRDFGWKASPSLERNETTSTVLPSPYHLSEKILLVANFGLRVVATSPSATWLNQREAACWRKFGGQFAALPRLVSETRGDKEWKIVLQLEEGSWTFARDVQPSQHLLAQTACLLH